MNRRFAVTKQQNPKNQKHPLSQMLLIGMGWEVILGVCQSLSLLWI